MEKNAGMCQYKGCKNKATVRIEEVFEESETFAFIFSCREHQNKSFFDFAYASVFPY